MAALDAQQRFMKTIFFPFSVSSKVIAMFAKNLLKLNILSVVAIE